MKLNTFPFELVFVLASGTIIILLNSCSKRPKEVLNEAQTVELLSDLQLASSYSDQHSSVIRDSARIKLAWGVMKQHEVTQVEFDSTLAWYGRNIDEYEKILEKVKVSIENKKKQLVSVQEKENEQNNNELWITSSNIVLSSIGNDILTFNIANPEIEKGDNIIWSLRMQQAPQYYLLLGMEYSDGHIKYITSNGGSRSKLELSLQTDTASTPTRLFGQMVISDKSVLPIYIDSISLLRFPFDSLEYRRKFNIQNTLNHKLNVKPKTPADTTCNIVR